MMWPLGLFSSRVSSSSYHIPGESLRGLFPSFHTCQWRQDSPKKGNRHLLEPVLIKEVFPLAPQPARLVSRKQNQI